MNSWTPDTCSRLVEVAGNTLRPGGLELSEHLLGFGNFQAGSRILDAGCGMGSTTRYLSQSGCLTAIGVDSSAAMIAAARQNSGGVPLVCAELERLPFGEASFDGIICECVLSQTTVIAVLAEFQRVLRADGLLLVSDICRRSGEADPAAEQVTADRLATKDQIETMLKDAGFTIEHWEDRTRDLQQLAIRLIMAPGPPGENLFDWRGPGNVLNECGKDVRCRDLGYYLLVARRIAR